MSGKEAKYVGETSRSPYQRGHEHQKVIDEAKTSHPLVSHFQEVHQGTQQPILMRIVRETQTALERQVWESVIIDRVSRKGGEVCLNLKSEWGGTLKPSLHSKERKEVRKEPRKDDREAGNKRGAYHGDRSPGHQGRQGGRGEDEDEAPAKRRNMRKGPEQNEEGTLTGSGANTP